MKRKIHIWRVNKWLNIALEYLTTHIISLANKLNSSYSPAYESGKNAVKEKNNFEKMLIHLSIHLFIWTNQFVRYVNIVHMSQNFFKSNKQSAKYD